MGTRSAGARAVDAVLAVAGVALNAVLIAAVTAGLVWLLPGKLAVAALGLYGFIVVGLLQAVAAFALLLSFAHLALGNGTRRDALRAVVLCAGFLVAVAMLNAYVLQLGALFGRDLTTPADGVPLVQFLAFDDHILAGATAAHAFIDHALPAGALARTGVLGLGAGLVLAVWLWLAKGKRGSGRSAP